MSFTPTVLPALDALRSIGDVLGLRPYSVFLLVRTWSGGRPGLGTMSDDALLQMVNTDQNGVAHPVQVAQLSRKDVIASGGAYSDQMLRVGPMTPTYTGGGFSSSQLDPTPTGAATEILWKVTGPALPSEGAWFTKIAEEASALHFFVTLKRTAVKP